MTKMQSIEDIRVGHILKFIGVVALCTYLLIALWFGNAVLLLIFTRLFKLHYTTGFQQFDQFATYVILFLLPLLATFPFIGAAWVYCYRKNDTISTGDGVKPNLKI